MKSNIGYMKTGTVRPAMLYSIYTLECIYSFVQFYIDPILNGRNAVFANVLDASREIVEAVEGV
ncbi:MAG: hypothetical protein WBL02_07440 [Methanomethylovorans sp.]|uniref:hypothetical protein n=1 Tax=Methanomethylovorans sp. TaxID=2758717 RepID=UPI003C7917F8